MNVFFLRSSTKFLVEFNLFQTVPIWQSQETHMDRKNLSKRKVCLGEDWSTILPATKASSHWSGFSFFSSIGLYVDHHSSKVLHMPAFLLVYAQWLTRPHTMPTAHSPGGTDKICACLATPLANPPGGQICVHKPGHRVPNIFMFNSCDILGR